MEKWRIPDSRKPDDKPQIGPACSIDSACPQGHVCVDGKCVPLRFLVRILQMSEERLDEKHPWS